MHKCTSTCKTNEPRVHNGLINNDKSIIKNCLCFEEKNAKKESLAVCADEHILMSLASQGLTHSLVSKGGSAVEFLPAMLEA